MKRNKHKRELTNHNEQTKHKQCKKAILLWVYNQAWAFWTSTTSNFYKAHRFLRIIFDQEFGPQYFDNLIKIDSVGPKLKKTFHNTDFI
jgi:hypothetical protein